jgi:hypothetical protein
MGTTTDVNGRFLMDIDNATDILIISFIGYVTEEIEVDRGTDLSISLTPDIISLSEVVAIGYGTQRSANVVASVSTISTDDLNITDAEVNREEMKEEVAEQVEQQLYQELLMLNSIRSNFTDVAFWEPRLYTDKDGRSKFKITFPDDITRWDALVYAMNRNLQTGTKRKSIKSYKPIIAELNTPQFLTRGDSAYLLGKVLNYTQDKIINGKVNWSGSQTDFEKDVQFGGYHTDKLPVYVTNTDSIAIRYVFTRDDGYLDGEERKVSVVEQGVVRTDGSLSVLINNEDHHIKASAHETVTVEILDNQIDIYGQEVKYLLEYKYACNEQLASKLIGLVNHKLLMQFKGKSFKYNHDVNKIIARLLKNQNQEFLWSWWDVSVNTSYWMSAHILRALKYAKDAGYKVDLNVENIAKKASYRFEYLHEYSIKDVDLLHALATWNVEFNYARHIHAIDTVITAEENMPKKTDIYYHQNSYLKERLMLQEIKQITGLPYQRNTLLKYILMMINLHTTGIMIIWRLMLLLIVL